MVNGVYLPGLEGGNPGVWFQVQVNDTVEIWEWIPVFPGTPVIFASLEYYALGL